jgi:quercetin dioxygenase-like cupin family protein
MDPDAAAALARIVIQQYEDVPEAPVSAMTVEGDQGWTRVMIDKDHNNSPDLFVSVFRMAPDQYHPLHRHPNMGELYFILKGRVEMTVGDTTQWMEPGTAIYTPKGVAHSSRTGPEGASILVVFPEGDWAKIGKEFLEEH